MKQLTGNQVRSMFLEYFKSKGHMVEPGASLVPHNDPTLLWINAGVAALKKYFDGSEKPKCNRITNAQKSIRTNDIENVGKTARHHTFFEMLGNFSIGDYFKKEAIPFAWEFLTSPEWIGFEKDRLYITVYPDDEEAYRIWTEELGVDPSHILKSYDNFWQIGEGPSGPDTEIYYDRGPEFDSQGLGERAFFEELENDRYIEVWNVVFSQYDAKEGVDRKDFKELPQKNIDTGMGLERLVCLIQGGETNFDTDLFLPVIRATEKLAKHSYDGEYKMAYRVIADHIRTVTFALADGALFSNEGRGYVLRRVLRRAVRYGLKLEINDSFMYNLVPVVIENMKDFYPYLCGKQDLIMKLVKAEEESFHATLVNGEKLLVEELKKAETTKVLPGDVAFKLYDTYGYPKELTLEIAEEKGIQVDLEGFEAEMEKQRERARNARDDAQSMASQSKDLMDYEGEFSFTGYTDTTCEAKVCALFKDGQRVNELTDSGEVIFDRSCFYAESGGQCADTGIFTNANGELRVVDVQKAPHGQFLHKVEVIQGSVHEMDEFKAQIDEARRVQIRANHSSLHLLQSALRRVIGDHVAQAGSYVCDEYARFDFTHFEKISDGDLAKIEETVNGYVMAKHPVTTEVMEVEAAKHSGAIALFDEKYGDSVRVVTMGDVSKELCGGTHVSNTQELGLFKIVSEESIGSGIRRIICHTGLAAYHDFVAYQQDLKQMAETLKLKNINQVAERVHVLSEENAGLKKEVSRLNEKVMVAEADSVVLSAEKFGDLNVLMLKLNQEEASGLKNYSEILRNKLENGFVFIANVADEKVTYFVASSKKAIEVGLKAGELAKLAATMSAGNGGGRPDLAQSGGKDASKVDEVFATIREKLSTF